MLGAGCAMGFGAIGSDIGTGFLLIGPTLLTGAALGIPKIFTASLPDLGVFSLLVYTGSTMVLVTLPVAVLWYRKARSRSAGRKLLPFAAYMSVTNQAAAVFLILALKRIPGSVVYPLRNIVNILLVFLVSIFLFRERVTLSEGIGTAIAVAGIAVVSASVGG